MDSTKEAARFRAALDRSTNRPSWRAVLVLAGWGMLIAALIARGAM